MKDQANLDKLRHSAAHLLAAAVMKLWPDTKRTIGPAIEDGFYFDFEFSIPISEVDLPKIEIKMKEIVKGWKSFEKYELSSDDAKKEYPDNPFKHELIDEFSKNGKTKLSFYKSGEYWDLCKGGHVEHPDKELLYFKLLSIAGAYWRGNENYKMLTRIYGTIFPTKEELGKFLATREKAKKRDHRKLGKELDLFTFSDLVGKGLPLFTEKGTTIWRELERFVVDEEINRGYKHVHTPNIAKTELYKTSGHYPYYKGTMYPPMRVDEEELILRPMTCPHHFALFMSRPRSYRELPIRYAEMASLYRYEKSGELTGLLRVREFVLADAHNFIRKTQAASEINLVIDLIEYISKILDLRIGEDFVYRLSLGNRLNTEKYFDAPKEWEQGETTLRDVLKKRNAPFYEAKDEAAFYGPKIDVQMKNVLGKEETAFTVQYDFCLPTRFNLNYIDENGKKEQPIVIHRSSIGAMERSIGFLIEHYAGNFPLWLSPIQVKIIPIAERHYDYSLYIASRLEKAHIRVEVDHKSESMQKKIRNAQTAKVYYMIIVGDREKEQEKVNVRNRKGETKDISLDKFIADVVVKIQSKAKD